MEQIFLFISSTFNFQLSVFSFQLKEKPHLYTKGGEKQYKDYEKNRRLNHILNADSFFIL